jgi:hypothetical protein
VRLAHLVNPFAAPPGSELARAQPITFETMRRARAFAGAAARVELFTAEFPEDRAVAPADFGRTPELTRSILDLGRFEKRRRLPVLRDLLDRLHAASDADYLVFTNVDIALMPHFYLWVARRVLEGVDALAINRRTISGRFTAVDELPLMYAELGEPHPGHDCFVWRRDAYPRYRLHDVCVGTIGVGKALVVNQLCTGPRWQEVTDAHLTFHLGAERAWLAGDEADYRAFNLGELGKIVSDHRAAGRLPDHPLVARFTRNLGV